MCRCGKTLDAPALARWEAAQEAERAYWYPEQRRTRAQRRAEETERAHWIAELLDIRPETVAGRSVLDIGGGPQPMVAWPAWPLARRMLVDPMPISDEDLAALGPGVERFAAPAEHYVGPQVDEAWGYNVLQHVQCPERVLATAMRHARTVRWFEWLDQPVTVVHPHVVTAATFDALAGWRCLAWKQGVRDEGRGWAQAYGAGIWERVA